MYVISMVASLCCYSTGSNRREQESGNKEGKKRIIIITFAFTCFLDF